MKTLITGSSGLVGSALVESLFKKGHSIHCLKRNGKDGITGFWATQSLSSFSNSGYDAVIHLAGENVADGRWTSVKKNKIMDSRVKGTRELVDFISHMEIKPKIFLCASAVGYYGSRGDEQVDEESNLGSGFLAEICKSWEEETQNLTTMGIRVVNLRFGMVLSPRGGALHKMVPPFYAYLGGIVGDGKQYVSWISIRDIIEIVPFIIDNTSITGPVNIVSPTPATNRTLTQSLGKALNRPTFFRIPSIIVRLIFGQMADEMLLASTRAIPSVLLEAGYQYKDKSLDDVLLFCTQSG